MVANTACSTARSTFQVSRLRKLVEDDPAKPRYIQTVWGFGYVFVPDDSNAGGAKEQDNGAQDDGAGQADPSAVD